MGINSRTYLFVDNSICVDNDEYNHKVETSASSVYVAFLCVIVVVAVDGNKTTQ